MPNLYRTGPPAAAAGERQQELEPRPEHGRHRGTQTGVFFKNSDRCVGRRTDR